MDTRYYCLAITFVVGLCTASRVYAETLNEQGIYNVKTCIQVARNYNDYSSNQEKEAYVNCQSFLASLVVRCVKNGDRELCNSIIDAAGVDEVTQMVNNNWNQVWGQTSTQQQSNDPNDLAETARRMERLNRRYESGFRSKQRQQTQELRDMRDNQFQDLYKR